MELCKVRAMCDGFSGVSSTESLMGGIPVVRFTVGMGSAGCGRGHVEQGLGTHRLIQLCEPIVLNAAVSVSVVEQVP